MSIAAIGHPSCRIALGIVCLACALLPAKPSSGRPFTVADEIAVSHFTNAHAHGDKGFQFSPDHRYLAAITEQGDVGTGHLTATLQIYSTSQIQAAIEHAQPPPEPLWSVKREGTRGPLMSEWRWTADSQGVAFLERIETPPARAVMLAELPSRRVVTLTPVDRYVAGFDIVDGAHFVYASPDPETILSLDRISKAAARVADASPIDDLLFGASADIDRSELWAVNGGTAHRVIDTRTKKPVLLFPDGVEALSLAPNGHTVATLQAVPEVPETWETRYPPPFPGFAYHLRAGRQNLDTLHGSDLVSAFSLIDVESGVTMSIVDAPTAAAGGWFSGLRPAWSQDSQLLVLPGTYLPGRAEPCVLAVDVIHDERLCVESLKRRLENGNKPDFDTVDAVTVEGPKSSAIVVHYRHDESRGERRYQRDRGGWRRITAAPALHTLTIDVRQNLNEPPTLAATNRNGRSLVLLDPNPQLAGLEMGSARVWRWSDRAGRAWEGGLYLPPDFRSDHRYPLVIQNHGFSAAAFEPSGIYPTAFAARALASAGIVVLQVRDCSIEVTPDEGPCNVDGYEAAIAKLVSEGTIDEAKIGIIGFSRTCFYVMQALTTSKVHFAAAEIADGVMGDFVQYLMNVDSTSNTLAHEYDQMMGAPPFGAGLGLWTARSPLFNIDKVHTPLRVTSNGRKSILWMWAPYASLRYLGKPTEFVLLQDDEHVLTNPAARMVSQGGTVDWFRFWLLGAEDPNPDKADQYRRWRALREMPL